jgi:predicted nucleic acid-binding protein
MRSWRSPVARTDPVLVDSNVIIDTATLDSIWAEWSSAALARLAQTVRLVINPLIYAEVSVSYQKLEELDAVLPRDSFHREPLPWEAAFLAGKCFATYRRRGGSRRSPLPDFYIGAHAAVAGYRLLTRDAGRYRSYFPKLDLIAPAASDRG